MDKKILRVLIVDDSPDDAELAATALRKSSYMLKTQRVQDLSAMQAALEKSVWDVVVCELTLAQFGAPMALDLMKRLSQTAPLIVFTHTVKEADVQKIMRAGAVDIIRKDEPFRLGPVVERELRVAGERAQWQIVAKQLNELESKHRAVVESAREAIGYCQDGMHIDANPTYLELFGYTKGDLEGVPLMNLIDKNDQQRFKEYLRKNSSDPQEFLAVKKDGGRLHIELLASQITLNNESCTQIVVTDVSKRKAAESRLQYLNQHDPLTGLYNRHYFLQALNDAVDKARKTGATSGVIYLDLNQIKAVNEEFGHAAGDRMLLKVARVFRDKLGDQVLLARFGGDEFAVLLNNVSDMQLKATAENLYVTLKDSSFTESGKTFTFHCNFGTVHVGKNTPDAQKLLSDVYHAAQRGQTSVPPPKAAPAPAAAAPAPIPMPASTLIAAPAPAPPPPPPPSLITSAPLMPTGMADIAPLNPVATPIASTADVPKIEPRRPAPKLTAVSGEWPTRLKEALEKNAFELMYQPIVNLHGEPAELFEVLVRLPGADGKIFTAGEFMPTAESAGLGPAIDRWVTQRAIEALRDLHREDRRATFFVNLCPASFRDPELIILTQKQMFAAGFKPKYLCFEADEEAILAAPAEARTFMQAVKKLGCAFTVDNFGNNMSNLNQLKDLPIDCLKIAGAHIRDLGEDHVAQTSLKALIHIAKAMEKKVIAKSVERAEDLAILWNLGVDYVQGHYFQEAGSHLSYDFGTEATLSSEVAAPNWTGR